MTDWQYNTAESSDNLSYHLLHEIMGFTRIRLKFINWTCAEIISIHSFIFTVSFIPVQCLGQKAIMTLVTPCTTLPMGLPLWHDCSHHHKCNRNKTTTYYVSFSNSLPIGARHIVQNNANKPTPWLVMTTKIYFPLMSSRPCGLFTARKKFDLTSNETNKWGRIWPVSEVQPSCSTFRTFALPNRGWKSQMSSFLI